MVDSKGDTGAESEEYKNKHLHQPNPHKLKNTQISSNKRQQTKQPLRRKNQLLNQPNPQIANQHQILRTATTKSPNNKINCQINPTIKNNRTTKITKPFPHTKHPLRRKNKLLNQPNPQKQPNPQVTLKAPNHYRNFKVESGSEEARVSEG